MKDTNVPVEKAYTPHRMGDHSDTWGGAGDDDPCYCNAPKETDPMKSVPVEK